MKRALLLLPLIALASACSFPRETAPTATATGAKPQAFSVADQPPIGDPAISRPMDAPTEFSVVENSAGTGLIAEWRKRQNTVRWQLEITRHDPTDQPFSAVLTVDDRPAIEWIVPAGLRGRVFNFRVRAAWPDGAVSAWTAVVAKGVGAKPVSVSGPTCWDYRLGERVPGAVLLPTCPFSVLG